MRCLLLGVLLASALARAQSLTVVVMDAQGLSEANVKRVHHAAVEQLRQLTPMPVSESYERVKKGCAQSDLSCQRERVKGSAVLLWLAGSKESFSADATFWLDGERASAPKTVDVSLEALDPGLKAVLEAVLPGWLKKGWGGLRLAEAPPEGSVLKVDGRVVGRRPEVVAVTAGPHQVDLLLPDGHAVLQRVEVQEANRSLVVTSREAAGAAGGPAGFSSLRLISYAAWMVGAATLLSAFIVGFVGRTTANGQNPCRPDSRGCVTLDEATEQARRAAGYASTANVLLGTGLALSVAGAGLFTIDVLR